MCGMRIALAVVSSVALIALTACSNDEPEVPQVSPREAEASVAVPPIESPAEEPEGPSDEDLRQFVELVSTNQPNDMKRALDLTAPDSAARAVVTVWNARYTATQQAGYDLPEPRTVTDGDGDGDGSFEVCSKEPPCQTYSAFTAQGDLIADFAIDGKRIRDRVILGSKKKYTIGDLATARLIGSYKFASDGSLGIFLEVTARADVTFGWDSDAYVGPDGAQVGTNAVEGPGTLRSGARAIVAYYFPKAQLGGDLFITAVEDGGAQRDENATIQTG
jgi:hypothetical protein